MGPSTLDFFSYHIKFNKRNDMRPNKKWIYSANLHRWKQRSSGLRSVLQGIKLQDFTEKELGQSQEVYIIGLGQTVGLCEFLFQV